MAGIKNDQKRPLVDGDTENQTFGCRHSNPNICAKNSMQGVCAFVSDENICNAPPASWRKLYLQLSEEQ